MTRIVVGVDDSPGGRAALRWALREADLRDAELEVVSAWSFPLAEGWNSEWPVDEAAFRRESTNMLEKLVAECAPPDKRGVTPVLVSLRCEGPAFGLIERAKDADLLVVGSRGRGGFTSLLLGSVSVQCVHHAPCTVVVVKTPAD